MSFTKLPPIEKSGVNQGCLCCPTPSIIARMDHGIAVGLGSAECTKDGELVYDSEADYQNDKEPKTIGDMEALAKLDPDHDWRVCFNGPLHGETYQRHMEDTWVMIESNMGLRMNPRLFQQIATKINRDIRTQGGVTADQVAAVASGVERTVSHPIIASIRAELLHHAKKDGEHFLWEE